MTLAALVLLVQLGADEAPALVVSEQAPPPPDAALEVVWRFHAIDTPGWFLGATRARETAAELQECRAARLEASWNAIPWWAWAAAGLAAGALGGFAASRVAR